MADQPSVRKPRPKLHIRQLQPGETPPSGEPRRYRDGRGYIRLRWKLGPNKYVEVYEHRLVAGVPAADVHHRDEDKGNNDPANLQILSHHQHAKHHGEHVTAASRRVLEWGGERSRFAYERRQRSQRRAAERNALLSRVRDLYLSGLSTIQVGEMVGRHPARISVILQQLGVTARPTAEYLPPIDIDAVRRWHAQGVRASEMMRRLGVGRKRLYQVFDQLGLPRFPAGRPCPAEPASSEGVLDDGA